jgi:hypothetical protein
MISAGRDDNAVVVLSVGAALSLASSVQAHPGIMELHFFEISFTDLSAFARAFQHNLNLKQLCIVSCTNLTTNLMENIC